MIEWLSEWVAHRVIEWLSDSVSKCKWLESESVFLKKTNELLFFLHFLFIIRKTIKTSIFCWLQKQKLLLFQLKQLVSLVLDYFFVPILKLLYNVRIFWICSQKMRKCLNILRLKKSTLSNVRPIFPKIFHTPFLDAIGLDYCWCKRENLFDPSSSNNTRIFLLARWFKQSRSITDRLTSCVMSTDNCIHQHVVLNTTYIHAHTRIRANDTSTFQIVHTSKWKQNWYTDIMST